MRYLTAHKTPHWEQLYSSSLQQYPQDCRLPSSKSMAEAAAPEAKPECQRAKLLGVLRTLMLKPAFL
jgi:hypothetical protein